MINPNPQLSLDALSDPQLVACAREGNPACFVSLMRRYRPKVRRSVGRLLGPAEYTDLEDVEQETFLKAWQHLSQFQGRASFRTWVTRIAINEVRMQHRRKASRKIPVSLDQGQPGQEEGEFLHKEAVSPDPDIESWLIQEDLGETLMRLIDELPPPLREMVHLRLAGLSEKETAERLGLPLGTVKSRMHRARRRLRRGWRQKEQGEDLSVEHLASASGLLARAPGCT